ncbi:MAG: hypothetical protein HKN27_08445 [Silicimonas sp.]|nr:hypothetical protein [Silicimonas sp.]
MSTEDYKNKAEGRYAYAKIAALVVVAGWTLYQWDKTIFPKERWDQSVRASSARVDLQLEAASFTVGSLVHDDTSDVDLLEPDNEARSAEGTPTLVQFHIPLKNERPFPVAVTVKSVSLREGTVPASGSDIDWQVAVDLDPADLFQIEVGTARTVEAGGSLQYSGYHVAPVNWCCADAGTKPVKLVEMSVDLSLQGIDPKTSLLVEGATKSRQLTFVGLLTEEASALAGSQFANAPAPINWANNGVQYYMDPALRQYFNGPGFEQMPPT